MGTVGLVGEKTTVADTYLAVSKLFDTVSLKIVPSKTNFFWMATHDRTQAESPTKGNDKCKSTTSEKEASVEYWGHWLYNWSHLISVQDDKGGEERSNVRKLGRAVNSNKGETQNGLQRIQNHNKRRSILERPTWPWQENSNLCFQRLAGSESSLGNQSGRGWWGGQFQGKEVMAILSLVRFIALFHLYLHKPNKRSSERNI